MVTVKKIKKGWLVSIRSTKSWKNETDYEYGLRSSL